MELGPKEPSHAAPAFFRYSLKYPLWILPFGMTYLYQGRIHKGYSRTLAQTAHLQEQYHIGPLLFVTVPQNDYRVGKILPHIFTEMVEVKVLKATVSTLVEQYHNNDHFALGHFRDPVASFSSRAIIDPVLVKNLVQFYAKIVDKTKKTVILSEKSLADVWSNI